MKKINWQIILCIGLILLSTVFYGVHYLIFRDAHHIFIYLLGDIAFVPIEVLLVTVIIHRLLSEHEKKKIMRKLNMVIGVFFSEVGTELLRTFTRFNSDAAGISRRLESAGGWGRKDFLGACVFAKKYEYSVDCPAQELARIREFLKSKRDFLLRLLENPNLLEHELFTDLLWAVFHLTEELSHRDDITAITQKDHQHIANDIKRAYTLLLIQWIQYMWHLRNQYPYLFSLSQRLNPFSPHPRAEIT